MPCAHHPDRDAVRRCRRCRRDLCEGCAVEGPKRSRPDLWEVRCRGVCGVSNLNRASWWLRPEGRFARSLILAAAVIGGIFGAGFVFRRIFVVTTGEAPIPFSKAKRRRLHRDLAAAAELARERARFLDYGEPGVELGPIQPGVDLSGVRVGQRYEYQVGAGFETWTITAVSSAEVRYQVYRRSHHENVQRSEVWTPPKLSARARSVLDEITGPDRHEVSGLEARLVTIDLGEGPATFALRGRRLAFPGLIARFPDAYPETGRRLLRVLDR